MGSYRNYTTETPSAGTARKETPVEAVVLPHTLGLLHHFHPVKWAKELREKFQRTSLRRCKPEDMIWVQIVVLDIAIRRAVKRERPKQLEERPMDAIGPPGVYGVWEWNTVRGWEQSSVKVVQGITYGWELKNQLAQSQTNTAGTEVTYRPKVIYDRSPEIISRGSPDWEHHFAKEAELKLYQWNLAGDLDFHCGEFLGGSQQVRAETAQSLADLLKLRGLFIVALMMIGPDSTDLFRNQDWEVEMPMI